MWNSFFFCLFTNSAVFSYASIEQVILHIALRRECVVKDGFCWHPFEGKFPVSFAVVNFLFIHVPTQSKVWHFCNFLFSNKYISSRQIAMNISLYCQVFLTQEKKNKTILCKKFKMSCKVKLSGATARKGLKFVVVLKNIPKTTNQKTFSTICGCQRKTLHFPFSYL